ncbi:MAG: hypothetical protein RQ826_16840, partial [Xanthomonadales bacterium]|nr:hypothetical protein [Xanthomonadales bacterium]
DGETGFVTPYREPLAAVPIIERLANDRNLLERLGQSARKKALREFDVGVYRKKLGEIYNDVLRR